MGGVGCDPEYLFTWPNALTGVMGGEQTALTMAQVVRVATERRGQPLDEAALQTPKGTPDRPFRWAMRCLLYFRPFAGPRRLLSVRYPEGPRLGPGNHLGRPQSHPTSQQLWRSSPVILEAPS